MQKKLSKPQQELMIQAQELVQEKFQQALSLHQQGQFAQAKVIYKEILRIQPRHFGALHLSGVIAHQTDDSIKAVELISLAIEVNPQSAAAYSNLASALKKLRQHENALHMFERAIALNPDFAEAYNNRGILLGELNQNEAALQSYGKAITIKPDYAEAYSNRGNLLKEIKRFDAAIEDYDKAIFLKPDFKFLYGYRLHTKMQLCDWSGLNNQLAEIEQRVLRHEMVTLPFPMLSISSSSLLQRKVAEIYINETHPANSSLGVIATRKKHDKIRIGYFSADFREHPVSLLMAQLFEIHDRAKFEVCAFSFGPDTKDEMRKRLESTFDKFLDVERKSDKEIAQLARSMELDIAIDLGGLTAGGRTGVFALRAAPIQVNYLGYPGTMGAEYIDYLVADHTLIPEVNQQFFSEKIAYLPNSYQVNDAKRAIAEKDFSREELGLPHAGFVFCCFNNSYKITPGIFEGWMRILKEVEGSVLWLSAKNPIIVSKLRNEANEQGVSGERLIFAERFPLAEEHLARQRAADLFLDTLPYNAQTTASDALWAGLPVLTCMGESFASRVAASLLNAIQLPELIATSQKEYEALAIELATNPERLKQIKQKLAKNRLSTPVFNTKLFACHIEDAYTQMVARYYAGLPPEHIHVVSEKAKPEYTQAFNDLSLDMPSRLYDNKSILLTIDDGPNPETTPLLLKVLAQFQAKASFFVCGEKVAANPDLAELIVSAGHNLLSHSFSHRSFITQAEAEIIGELDKTERLLSTFRPTPSPYFIRLPYGIGFDSAHVNNAVIKWRKDASCIQWDFTAGEWLLVRKCQTQSDVSNFCDKAVQELSRAEWRGKVILLHDWPSVIENETPRFSELRPSLCATLLEKILVTIEKENLGYALLYTPNGQGNADMLIHRQAEATKIAENNLIAEQMQAKYEQALTLHQQGQVAQAKVIYDEILKIQPSHFGALHLSGVIALQLNDSLSAVELINRAIATNPHSAAAYNNLGAALKKCNQYDEALQSYDKAIALNPDFVDGYYNRGILLNELKRYDAALHSYDKTIALSPEHAGAYNNRGNAFLELKQYDAALNSFDKAIVLKPEYADAYFNRGNVLKELGQFDAALQSYDKGLVLKPEQIEAYIIRGSTLQKLKQYDAALQNYDKVILLKPDYAEAHYNRGLLLYFISHIRDIKQHEAALLSLSKAILFKSDYADAYACQANIYLDFGRFGEAQFAIEKALEIQADNISALALLPRLRKMTTEDSSWLKAVQSIISRADPALSTRETILMQFALGKYYDDTKQYDLAFAAYQRGNIIKRQRDGAFDRSQFSKQVDALISINTEEVVCRLREGASESHRPILIVGMPRSGTSLIEQIIASHPGATGAGELSFWDAQAQQHQIAVMSGNYEPTMLAGVVAAYEQLLHHYSADATRIVDKMPNNYIWLGLIHAAFPQAKIIHSQRNPIDTCLSIYFQNFENYYSYVTDIDDLAFYYREYSRLMQHWRNVLPAAQFLEVPYEALVDDQAAWSRKIIQFIGLDWDERCLDFYKTDRKVATASNWQVKQKIYTTSKARWLNYESHLGALRGLLELKL